MKYKGISSSTFPSYLSFSEFFFLNYLHFCWDRCGVTVVVSFAAVGFVFIFTLFRLPMAYTCVPRGRSVKVAEQVFLLLLKICFFFHASVFVAAAVVALSYFCVQFVLFCAVLLLYGQVLQLQTVRYKWSNIGKLQQRETAAPKVA